MQECIPKIKEGFPQKKDVSSIKRMSDGNIKAPQNILSPNSWHSSTVAPNGLKEFSHVYDCASALYLGSNSQVWMVKQKGSGTTRVAKFLIPNASTLEIKILNFLKGRGGTVKLEDCLFNTSTNQYVLIFPFINLFSPNQAQMTAKDLKLYMYELLKSLAFCHGHNIVHCDLKPDNTMYHNGSFCLIDFGHAAMCHGNKASLMACNRYMAPELQQASTSYDTGIDVWAAAVIMTEKIFNITFKDAKEIYLFVKSASQPYMWEKMRQSPACSQPAIELLAQMLRWNPCHRISAHDAMQHHYFDDCRIPQPVISTAYIDP